MPHRKRDLGRLHRVASAAGSPGFFSGNQVTLLQNGEAYFPALILACDRAKYEIYVEAYIYENDTTGQRIANALIRAAKRGVKVYLLIDGYGSKELPHSIRERLKSHGIEVLVFRPKVSPWTLRRKRLRRMHRKIAVVDREIAFVGGINIIDDMGAGSNMAPRYDYAVAVEGPLVDVIRLSVKQLWSRTAWTYYRKRTVRAAELPVSKSQCGSMNAAFLVRDNFHHRRDIEEAYLREIKQAKHEIILAHAYFLPGFAFRHALINAAQRGVRVILVLQGKVEILIEYYASWALYGGLLSAGIEIYEYEKSYLHAKVAVIDGHWATVGSSNIDPFSLLLSLESNVIVDDNVFGMTLSQSLKRTMESDCRQVLKDNWKQQPLVLRFISWLCYGLLRLMVGMSGYDTAKGRDKNK